MPHSRELIALGYDVVHSNGLPIGIAAAACPVSIAQVVQLVKSLRGG